MKLAALLFAVSMSAVAQAPVMIPADDFEAIKQEFAKMRSIIEVQERIISKLRARYDCT